MTAATDTTRTGGSTPPPGRNRNLSLLVAANVLSLTGNAAVPIGVSFAVLDLTGRPGDVALVLMAETIPMIGLVLLGGVWGDRVDRKRLMVTADLIRCLAAGVAGVLLLAGQAGVAHLVVLMAVYGAASAFFQPAVAGLLPTIVTDPARLQHANGLLMATSGMTWILGPLAAAGLIAWSGAGAVFLFDAATFLWSAFAVAAIRVPARVARTVQSSVWRDLVDGWREFTARSWVWMTIVSAGAIFTFVIAPLNALGPAVADDHFGGATAWAAVVAGLSFGRVLGGVMAMSWMPRHALFWACAMVLLQALATLVLAVPAPLWLVVAGNVVGGLGVGFFISAWGAILQQWIPADRISRVNSYDWFGTLVAMPSGYVLVALLVGPLGVPTLLYAATGAVLLAILPLLAAPAVRGLTRPADRAEARA